MTQDYVTLYLNSIFAKDDLHGFLSLMFLFMGRMFPILAMAPFFGAKVLPHSAKVVFGLSLFVIFLPQLTLVTHTDLGYNTQLIFFFLKEIFIGIVLGFIISLPFMIVQSTGIMIDHQRGGASLMVNDPTVQNQSSPLGTLFNLLLINLFFMIDGPFTVIEIISESYNMVPPDKFLNWSFFSQDYAIYKKVMGIMGSVMILSTQMAAPALIIILMTDFFLGIANRLAPQVQVTFLGMPLKSLLGLAILYFGWFLFNEEMVAQAYKALNEFAKFVEQFKPSSI
ncbi:MAG: flagellar biosynthetic protein FliR [Parachlamydiaceae bacterium]|nr:flagellar biosynthetic protein FliR [Parachlamydiaceae bacterium]